MGIDKHLPIHPPVRRETSSHMSKLSVPLKGLINASFAKPGTIAAPKHISSVYQSIQQDATSKDVGLLPWLTISTAATMTMNSPESLTQLHQLASKASSPDTTQAVKTAEFMREVGLKCISFNGIPRTINCLGEFRAGLPAEITSAMSTKSIRTPFQSNIDQIKDRGFGLWKSIYDPFDEKLIDKLAQSHPDLPVHILNSHYGALLADFPEHVSGAKVGRILTSIVAVSCLRAQTGVGPQVISHLFGLRKAFDDGTYVDENEGDTKGSKWLASDEGNMWILKTVDSIVEAIGGGSGSTFAPGMRAKL